MAGFVVLDPFVDSNGTALASHTPNLIGTGWTEQVKTGVSSWEINGNEAEATGTELSDACMNTISDEPATAEYHITVRLDERLSSGDDPFFVVGRFTDTSNYYLCGAWPGSDAADKRLHKVVATTVTEIATGDLAAEVDDRCRFEITDARKAMFWADAQGTPTISSTDDVLTSIGIAGIALGNLVTSTDDISASWDAEEFSIIDIEDLECFDDFFEAGADVTLTSHTPDTGETWALEEQTGASLANTDGDNSAQEAAAESNDRIIYSLDRVLTDAEYQTEIYFNELATNTLAAFPYFVVARFADTSNFYFGGTYAAAATADKKIYKEVATTVSEIATGDAGFAASSFMTFKVLDATKKIFWNGSEAISTTDNAITAKGEVGFGMGNLAISTDDISAALDVGLFVVSDIGGAVAIPTINLVTAPYIPA